jgi:hypothetical protein
MPESTVGFSHCSKKGSGQASADLGVDVQGKHESQPSVCSRPLRLFIAIANSHSFLTPTITENGGFFD